jgi:hypothetical protein
MMDHLHQPADRPAEREREPEPRTTPQPQDRITQLQRSAGNRAVCGLFDMLSETGEDGAGTQYLDETRVLARNGPDAGTAAPAGGGSAAPAATAVPVNLRQIVTAWAPGASKYGFQVKFQVSSSSGSVADLQSQATLRWREYVTYSRNDFAHRINPPSPTILPPGGIGFGASDATVISPNVLEFKNARDTHWMPTSAVREADFATGSGRSLPAIMESSQLYQFTTDGSTWTDFAGPTLLTRTFAEEFGPPAPGQTSMPKFFTTTKAGVHTVTEAYKP